MTNRSEKSGQRTAICHFSFVIFHWSFAKSLSGLRFLGCAPLLRVLGGESSLSEIREGGGAVHDRPYGLHLIASHAVDAVVKVDVRVAMRNDPLQPVAEPDLAVWILEGQSTVFVPRKTVFHAGQVLRLRAKFPIRGKRFE